MRLFSTLLLAGLFLSSGCAAQNQKAPTGSRAPEFVGGKSDWLNSPPISLADVVKTHQTPDGKPVRAILVDFWEYTCVNCIRTFPYLKEWNKRYARDGLLIVGIHTPEFAFAREHTNVADAVKRFGLEYPILIDSDYRNWNAWGNNVWPRHYLLDASGRVVDDRAGEGGYLETEEQIQALLKRGNPGLALPKPLSAVRDTDREGAVCYPVTPEVYAGYARGRLDNPNGPLPDRNADYTDPGQNADGAPALSGRWRVTPEAVLHESERPSDYVGLRYHALEVNAVMRPESKDLVRVYVTQDGRPVAKADAGADVRYDDKGRAYVDVDAPRMYAIVRNAKYGTHTVRLSPAGSGLGLYSYTFGSCTVPGGNP